MDDTSLKHNPVKNIFESLEKPTLDECYICFEPIGNGLKNGAIHPYRCRHHVCASCFNQLYTNNMSSNETFIKRSTCGVCRAEVNQYIIGPAALCQVAYSQSQTIYVPEHTINKNSMFRDHLQHIIAHANISNNRKTS
jgi:hypothetical protein